MSRVLYFEIQADDLERARSFYADVFGWSFDDYTGYAGSPYWGIVTGPAEEPGIDGGLLPRTAPRPEVGRGANGFVCTVVIADYDATERRIMVAGGELIQPKRALPGMAWQGYYLDTEGNTFGIHQPDTEAS